MKKEQTALWSSARFFPVFILVLSLLGLLFVFEASTAEALKMVGNPFYFLQQQAIRVGLGVVALVMIQFIPIAWWQKIAPLAYGGSLLLLVAVFIPGIGLELNGASRWLSLGGFVFQPVEIAKFGVVLFFAHWLSQHQRLMPLLFLSGLPALLLMLQPDLGSTLVLLGIAFGMYFVAGGKMGKLFLAGLGLAIVLVPLILFSPYRRERVTTFFDPNSDPLGSSFHVRQLILALGNGGWMGQGIGNSKQKYFYIPEASSDSIFAIVAEETGFLGATGVMLLFTGYVLTASQLIQKHKAGSYAQLVGAGMLIWIALQWLLNIAAVVALVPLTGIPLPFFSYGGTAQFMILAASGMIWQLRKVSQK